MATGAAVHVGKREMIIIPAKLRRQLHLEEGAYIIVEACSEGIRLFCAERTTHPFL